MGLAPRGHLTINQTLLTLLVLLLLNLVVHLNTGAYLLSVGGWLLYCAKVVLHCISCYGVKYAHGPIDEVGMIYFNRRVRLLVAWLEGLVQFWIGSRRFWLLLLRVVQYIFLRLSFPLPYSPPIFLRHNCSFRCSSNNLKQSRLPIPGGV